MINRIKAFFSRPSKRERDLIGKLEEAHDALREIAFVLGAGGYNSSEVDVNVFRKKISWGIDNLVAPLEVWIRALQEERDELKGLLRETLTPYAFVTKRTLRNRIMERLDGSNKEVPKS